MTDGSDVIAQAQADRLPVEAVDLLTRIMRALDAATHAPVGPIREQRRKELFALLDEGQNHPLYGDYIVNTVQRILDQEQSVKFAR